jgi:lipopolysaccharide transport system permease protein
MRQTVNSLRFWQLVVVKIRMNLKSEAAKNQLNYVWWLLEPALFIAVYYVVFGILLNSRTDNFIAFCICGKIPFLWLARSLGNASNSLVSGGGLMNQIDIPKLFFPVITIGQDLVKTFVVFIIMLSIMWGMGYQPSLAWLAIIPVALMQLLFISSLAIVFASLIPFLPDLRFIVQTFTMLMMFASGIFYDPVQLLLPEHLDLFMLNPLAAAINMYRGIIMEGLLPDWSQLVGMATGCGLGLIIAILLIRKFDHKYPRLVLQ